MSKERLELVTDFGSLRSGMICVATNCDGCKVAHRFILLAKHDGNTAHYLGGNVSREQYFTFSPTPCAARAVGEYAVTARVLYRVVDGLEQPERSKSKKVRVP